MNKLPSSAIEGKSPYEMLYARPPSLTHLRVIGCLCFASVIPKGDKFAARAKASVLMGYSERQKSYLLLELATNRIFVSRDVVFKESVFSFAKQQEISISYNPSVDNLDSGIFDVGVPSTGVADNSQDINQGPDVDQGLAGLATDNTIEGNAEGDNEF